MYGNTKSLCCTPGTNSVADQLHFKNKHTKKQTHIEKGVRCAVPGVRGGGQGIGWRQSKWYRLPVTREISAMDVRCNLINTIHNAVCYIRKLFGEETLTLLIPRREKSVGKKHRAMDFLETP